MNINFFMGSWGDQPHEPAPRVKTAPAGDLLTRRDWYDLAQRFDVYARAAVTRGDENEAYTLTMCCVRFCRKHQLAGGHPADGGEKDPFKGFRDDDDTEPTLEMSKTLRRG